MDALSWGRGRRSTSANSTGLEVEGSSFKSVESDAECFGRGRVTRAHKKWRGGGTGWGGDRCATLPRRGLSAIQVTILPEFKEQCNDRNPPVNPKKRDTACLSG